MAAKLDEWQGRILLIRIYNELKEYNKAEMECKLIENIKNDNRMLQLVFLNEYGFLLINQNRIDEAIAEFNIALTLNPNSDYAKEKLEETNEKRTNK